MAIIYILISIFALVIHIYFCGKFSEIAQQKGHEPCFGICFFLGMIGFVYVAALPNKVMEDRLEKIEYRLSQKNTPSESIPLKAPSKEPAAPKVEKPAAEEGALIAEITNGLKVCPKCHREQKADRHACWYCNQKFEN